MQRGLNAVRDLEPPITPSLRDGQASLTVIATTLVAFIAALGEKPLNPSEHPTISSNAVELPVEEPAINLLSMPPGMSIINKDMLIDLSSDSHVVRQVKFRIDRNPQTKDVSMTVDGKTYISKDTIWWLGFARATDVLSDIQTSGDGGIMLTADTIGYATVSPEDVRKVAHRLSLSPKDITEITLPVKAYPTEGSVAEKMLGNKPNEVNCTIHAEYAGLNAQQLAKK